MSRQKELEEQINKTHDWLKGQTWSGGGTKFYFTDRCLICGLERHYESDAQNGVSAHYTFSHHYGQKLTLREAAELQC